MRSRLRRRQFGDHAPVPTITALSPSVFDPAGGETVTITGTGFRSPGGEFSVSFVTFGKTRAASFAVASDESMTAVTPAAPGEHVYVTTPGGTAIYPQLTEALQTEAYQTLLTEAAEAIRE